MHEVLKGNDVRVVNQSYEFVEPSVFGIDVSTYFSVQEKLVEAAGRTCYKSEDATTESSHTAFCSKIKTNKHDAMLEFGSVTVKFVTNRGVLAEFTRHRLCSFAAESTRYCDYSKDKFSNEVTFVKPSTWGFYSDDQKSLWKRAMKASEDAYLEAIAMGYSPQQARGVLPNDLKTTLVVKANFREWTRIFELRCSKAAHPDISGLLVPLRDEMARLSPAVFG